MSWYPDGTHLAVTWVEGPKTSAGLWQISIFGGAPRKLIDDVRCASVSREGSQIAFVRALGMDAELWVMGANGENPRRLVFAERSVFGVPAWSPDGQRSGDRERHPMLCVLMGSGNNRLFERLSINHSRDKCLRSSTSVGVLANPLSRSGSVGYSRFWHRQHWGNGVRIAYVKQHSFRHDSRHLAWRKIHDKQRLLAFYFPWICTLAFLPAKTVRQWSPKLTRSATYPNSQHRSPIRLCQL